MALPDRAAAERVFTNRAHDGLHELAADPRLDRTNSAEVLESMQAVEVDFDGSPQPVALAEDLETLRQAAAASLEALGVDAPACSR